MTVGIWVLGDQLSQDQAALKAIDNAPVILIESLNHVHERQYHKQKLILIWSAMRHFAQELRSTKRSVTYIESETFEAPLIDWIQANSITELRVMSPIDRPFAKLIESLNLPCDITIVPNNHFLWTETDFLNWAKPRKRMLMEDFYREGRKRFGILMNGDKPIGDRWNFDQENRKPPRKEFITPEPLWFEPDEMTTAVIKKVESINFPTYGSATPFLWAVTRDQALQVLETFIKTRLPTFGPYQDAMVTGEETMWHALISPYLNIGLLNPLEIVRWAERAYHLENLSLNSVEGFIRQVLGWREYMRGIYLSTEDDYPTRNWFNHTQPLPAFFWDSTQTEMNCLRQSLSQVERTGYGHHIQRLMILSNFALISGISPQAIENWFHAAFIDAYDWVMQTNVIGMGQFADGGILASKPYASSANYVNKMSDYCTKCCYNPKTRIGDKACPFNFFYWDFLDRHREKLTSQGRMSFILANLDKMTPQELTEIRSHAKTWHQNQKQD
ncbi:MAG: cryptochrome/photolyase family protein [Phormidium tanganyikae FI6-MK23]|jgi:deoxyribodipyrimidine photolyase-related protein|nr:cryptochrome/photolyase family protein [Phormidium tanganyikae FI6-MK23]